MPHITTDGTGRREAMPDLAMVEVAVTGDGCSAGTADATARDHAAIVRESLPVSDDRIRTVERCVDDTSELFEPETDAQFQATERLVVDCVPDTAADVVVEAADAGATVRTVDFHLHESVRQKLQDEALADATARAREKAERIAAVEDLQVTAVREMTAVETSDGMESFIDEGLPFDPDDEFNPGPVAVTGTVTVEFDLEPA